MKLLKEVGCPITVLTAFLLVMIAIACSVPSGCAGDMGKTTSPTDIMKEVYYDDTLIIDAGELKTVTDTDGNRYYSLRMKLINKSKQEPFAVSSRLCIYAMCGDQRLNAICPSSVKVPSMEGFTSLDRLIMPECASGGWVLFPFCDGAGELTVYVAKELAADEWVSFCCG